MPKLMRVLCLILVFATGASGIAFADHGGSHGTHCVSTDEAAAAHQHSSGDPDTAHYGNGEQSCVQHSCVAVFNARIFAVDLHFAAVAQTPHPVRAHVCLKP